MTQIHVHSSSQPYAITIEPGLLVRLGEEVRAVAAHGRAMLVVDEKIAASHGAVAAQSMQSTGYDLTIHRLVAEETSKTLECVRELYGSMLKARLERGSLIIAMGGGIVGDVAGFAAATYLRGLPVVQVPTTLLAMVDASIGGKTGVNFQRTDGLLIKNMVGAFWQPRGVLIDPQVLHTLELRDFRCGLAECVKHGMIADASLLTFLGANAGRIAALDMPILAELIVRSVSIKVRLVEKDERESGCRALLNLGHTFGHAIESMRELDLRHGEAVSIGLCAAAHCSVRLGHLRRSDADQVIQLLERLGLPTRAGNQVSIDRVREAMNHDKKIVDGRMRLVLPVGVGRAEIFDDVPMNIVQWALMTVLS